jgi:hypothetical protein
MADDRERRRKEFDDTIFKQLHGGTGEIMIIINDHISC